MTPEVATRLKEITVDPKTVTLQKKVDLVVGDVHRSPRPTCARHIAKYKATLGAGGQNMAMTITRGDQGRKWGMGRHRDRNNADGRHDGLRRRSTKGTLVATKRSIRQGPMEIDLVFAEGKATGTIGMNGQSKPVSVDLGGPLFADGGGSHAVLATLPLAEGYTVTFRNFDVQKQKVVAQAGEGHRCRAGHRAGRHVRGVEGAAVVRRR